MTITIKSKQNLIVQKDPKKINPDDMLTPTEARKVRLGMKQIREGKFKLWADVKQKLSL